MTNATTETNLLPDVLMRHGTRALQAQTGYQHVNVSCYGDILVGHGWRAARNPWEATMWCPGPMGPLYGYDAWARIQMIIKNIRRRQEDGSLPDFLKDSAVRPAKTLGG
jgi:hypothetical protein